MRRNMADWLCYKILISLGILTTQNRPLEEFDFMYLRQSNFCSKKLDVQEANCSFTQFCWIWGHILRCRFTHGWSSHSRSLGFVCWSIASFFWSKPRYRKTWNMTKTVRVVLAYTGTFWLYTRRRFWIHTGFFHVFSPCRNTQTHTNTHTHTHQTLTTTTNNTTTTTTHTTQHNTETDRERQRQTETERDRERETRQDKKREDETRQEGKRREDKRREKREEAIQEKRQDEKEESRSKTRDEKREDWKREDEREKKRPDEKEERRWKGKWKGKWREIEMKRGEFFPKNVWGPSNPPDELAQHVSKKIPLGRIIPPFFFESSESDRVFKYLHDSNSIFRAAGINSEIFSARTVLLKTTDTCLNHQSLLGQQKILRCKTTRENCFLVLWHGRSCEEMRGKALLIGIKNNVTVVKRFHSLSWRPPIQGRRIGIRWRIVKTNAVKSS